ncbi:MAG: hypothetical protein KGY99_07000 [Phycisphaerae bacterium]|nr:hypothetical protein [Phycisphaerae bacterium]
MNALREIVSGVVLFWLAACCASAAEPTTRPAADADGASQTRPVRTQAGITLSRETTYVTGPLNDDGTVNYVEYLNRKHSKGVTPETNAAVGLLKVLGPEMIVEETRAETFKRLGMDPLPAEGEYFVHLSTYVEALPADRKPRGAAGAEAAKKKRQELQERIEAGGPDAAEAWEELWALPESPETPADIVEQRREQAMEGPWTAEQYPILADWLEANAGALDGIVAASKRPRYYVPLVSLAEPAQIIDTLLPALNSLRTVARALRTRAMLRWGGGDVRGAWADLLAMRRLARLLCQDATLIAHLMGIATEAVGADGMQRLGTAGALEPADARHLLAEVRTLEPLPDIRNAIANERFMMLDCIMMMARGCPPRRFLRNLQTMREWPPAAGNGLSLDYNLMLRRINEMWNWYLNCLRIEDRAERDAALQRFEDWLIQTKLTFAGDRLATAGAVISSALSVKRRTEVVTNLLVSVLMPTLGRATVLWQRANADGAVTLGATVLAAYHAETGAYPDKLAALTPTYLQAVPTDPFTGEPLIYKRTDAGYVLYSVGENLDDDGGIDAYDTGDIAVTVDAEAR